MIRISLSSVYVDDQEKALRFYTGVLGFVKKTDMPAGEFRWLTVTSPASPGVELVLEPNAHPAAQAFTTALKAGAIPLTSFATEDLDREYERLTGLGVVFTMPPTDMGTVRIAVFDDTCGNLIQLHQAPEP